MFLTEFVLDNHLLVGRTFKKWFKFDINLKNLIALHTDMYY